MTGSSHSSRKPVTRLLKRISRDFNDPIRETRVEEVAAYSFNMDFNKKIGSRNDFFYGVEAVFDDRAQWLERCHRSRFVSQGR